MARSRLPDLDYVERTRHVAINLLFLMPWLLVYQLALVGSGSRLDNAAAVWLRSGIGMLGRHGFVVASLVASLVLCLVVLLRLREAARDRGVFGGMMVESVVYGFLLGLVASVLSRQVPMVRPHVPPGTLDAGGLSSGTIAALRTHVEGLGLALGAGIFEELVFRGVLVGGMLLVVGRGLGAGRTLTACLAVPAAAWVFSAWHHWGAGAEPWSQAVFTFRFHAGLVLGVIYVTRGLGIAALAHGVYDVLVLAQR